MSEVKIIYNTSQKVAKISVLGKREHYSIVLPDINMRNPNFFFIKNSLEKSGKFKDIKNDNFSYSGKFYKFKVNDIVCLIDGDDTSKINEDFIKKNMNIFGDVNFVFILQFCYQKAEEYFAIRDKLGINIFPLIYGTTKNFPVEKFKWRNIDHKYIANFAFTISRGRLHRRNWVDYVRDDNKFFTDFIFGPPYVESLKETKWGVSIKGSGLSQDGKCFRETEFMSLGMPLALNYMPCYPFPFYPGVHYLYLKSPKDIDLLKEIDPVPFSKQSLLTWKKYVSPYGLSNLLINILFREKYRNSILDFWVHFFSKDFYEKRKKDEKFGKKISLVKNE